MSPEPEKRSDEEEWERLAEAATPGPWSIEPDQAADFYGIGAQLFNVDSATVGIAVGGKWEDGGPTVGACSKEDAEFIAAARTAVPALLAALAAVRARIEKAAAVLIDGNERSGTRAIVAHQILVGAMTEGRAE